MTINNVHHIFDCPCYDRKSFYGKAKILDVGNGYYLQSYDTIVCYIDKYAIDEQENDVRQFAKLWNDYSVTTMRHINAFMHFNCLPLGGKKWWDSLEYNQLYTVDNLLWGC